MEKFDELLEKLKGFEIIQKYGGWEDNIPKHIWDEYFENADYTISAENLDVDTHRWYETSITVINIYGRYLGVRHITGMFSESQLHEDCYVQIEFYEMKEVETITYQRL